MAHRFLSYTNMYLSPLQAGLQSAHALAELFVKYPPGHAAHAMLDQWARHDKTMILLNGGYADTLKEIHRTLEALAKDWPGLPFAQFHEEEAALNGALTCVATVFPEEAWTTELSAYTRDRVEREYGQDTLAAARDRQFSPVERAVLLRQNFRLAG